VNAPVPRSMEPTRLQQSVLDFCLKTQEEKGYFPPLREIAKAFGWNQAGAASSHLNGLVRKGKLERFMHGKQYRWRFIPGPTRESEAVALLRRAVEGKVEWNGEFMLLHEIKIFLANQQ